MDIQENKLDYFLESIGVRLPKYLFHYTRTLENVHSIRNGILCANIRSLSDKREGEIGWKCVKKYIPTKVLPTGITLDEIEIARKGNKSINLWTFSLTEHPDNFYMLDNYGTYKISLNSKDLHRKVQTLMANTQRLLPQIGTPKALHFFLPCFYLGRDNEQIKRVINFLFKGNYIHNLSAQWKLTPLQLTIACSLMFDCMVKEEKFAIESEWRLFVVTFETLPPPWQDQDSVRLPFLAYTNCPKADYLTSSLNASQSLSPRRYPMLVEHPEE